MTRPSRVEKDVGGQKSVESGLLANGKRIMDRVNGWIVGASTIAILAASLVLTLGVLLRYFLKVPTDWQDETAVFLIVGAIFMCGGYAQSYRRHVGIEALASILPAAVNHVRGLLVDVGSFAFCAFFSWKSWTLLQEAIHEGQTTSSSFAPPLWIPYGLMATGMTILSLQVLLQIPTHFVVKKEET
jgi:TRAP-type C4-dicarboxylate transport system permease small subunit